MQNVNNEEISSTINAPVLMSEIEDLILRQSETPEYIGLFTLKTANRWVDQAKRRPIPKMLFDEFWYEGEICMLFADTGMGKSILAVQIGNSISKGEHIPGFRLETRKQRILYFDFELSEKQFENRYSIKYDQHYVWDENFIRVEINSDAQIPDKQSFEDFLNLSLENSIIETGSKILIIDNLTYLKNETEKAKDALPLMKHLKALKKKYDLSILALAHTPKRDLSKPITRNDLQGSKMLMSFTDSSFTIGESQLDKNIRYVKQIKVRQKEFSYDGENVMVCQIHKAVNFSAFELMKFDREQEHLKQRSEADKNERNAQIMDLNAKGKTLREIGNEFGISHQTAKRVIDKIKKA